MPVIYAIAGGIRHLFGLGLAIALVACRQELFRYPITGRSPVRLRARLDEGVGEKE